MAYLLDANVFIHAADRIYRMRDFPGYWDWIRLQAEVGRLATVTAIREELVSPGVSDWANSLPNHAFRPPDTASDQAFELLSDWVNVQPRFTERAIDEFLTGADSDLIAAAIANSDTVVTYEISAPSSKRRVKIPDVCQAFGIECIFPQDMLAREGARFVLDDTVRTALATSRASPIRS